MKVRGKKEFQQHCLKKQISLKRPINEETLCSSDIESMGYHCSSAPYIRHSSFNTGGICLHNIRYNNIYCKCPKNRIGDNCQYITLNTRSGNNLKMSKTSIILVSVILFVLFVMTTVLLKKKWSNFTCKDFKGKLKNLKNIKRQQNSEKSKDTNYTGERESRSFLKNEDKWRIK